MNVKGTGHKDSQMVKGVWCRESRPIS